MFQKIGDHINKTMGNLTKLNVIKDVVTKRLLFFENEEGYKIPHSP